MAFSFADAIDDSDMTRGEALRGINGTCPEEILRRQELVRVWYYSFDERIHRGQLVIDELLVDEVLAVFRLALEKRFPINSVIPVSHSRFLLSGVWDDDLSMRANNSSGFNYRMIAGTSQLSAHALGRAIDINPMQNPFVRNDVIQPPGAQYDPRQSGTLTRGCPVVNAFLELGWFWGADLTSLKDYQHFQKDPFDESGLKNE